jgi:3-oxoacyl-[acyl-carrier protein] reductase
MVKRFAEVTGDRSSLHLSDEFASRSAYRRPVVHGMLPVAFISLLQPFHAENCVTCLRGLSGRFTAPVFTGDELTLTAEPSHQEAPGEASFDYRIERDETRTVVTTGRIAVAYLRDVERSLAAGGDATMLLESLELSNDQLVDITVGMTDGFSFRVSGDTVRAFVDLVSAGVLSSAVDASSVADRFYLPNLLSVLAFSTSVGVSLPGRPATFLEFSSRATGDIALGCVYRLQGTVSHRSMATRIIKKQLVVASSTQPDAGVITGKASILVNKPFQQMPGMVELKEAAAGWGLDGKVTLITGASRGIGETTAKLLALLGSKVIVNYHRGADDARRVVQEIGEAGGDAIAVAADVSKPEDVARLVDEAIARFGRIDVLVNNAARDFRPIPFLNLTWDEVERDLDVVAKGAFLCCQHVIPRMLAQGGGRIINITSVATDDPPPDHTKYVMSKSALVGLTRSLSIEFASRNIQINMVAPNFVETDLVAHVPDGFRRRIAQETPMRRLASPIDVAQAVAFLASSFSSFTTGQKVLVTGGGAPYL